MLIAEELLLLLTDDMSGKFVIEGQAVDLGLAGACVLELAELGRVGVAEAGEPSKPGRLVVRDASATGDAVLDQALDRLRERQGKKPERVLAAVQKGVRPALLDRLAGAGLLRREPRRVLGVFPTTRWPAGDPRREAEGRIKIKAVLLQGALPDPRTAALISLLSATGAVVKVVSTDGERVDKRAVKKRAKEIAEQQWAADAVGKSIQAVHAAVMGAVVASMAAGAAAGGG